MSSHFLKATALTFTAAFAFSGTSQAKITTGSTTSDLAVVDSNGITHNLSDYAGKTVVLEWTNHDCPYVKKHYSTQHPGGNMQNLQKSAAADGIVWLSVISSAPGRQGHVSGKEANALTTRRDAAPSAVIIDSSGEAGRMFSAKTTPHMYIIDADQTLVYQGAIDDNPSTRVSTIAGARNYVTEALNAMKAGTPITTAETSPYGCSVKY